MLVVTVAGAVGAVARYLVSGWAQDRASSGRPVGTLVVNLTGALGLGLIAGGGSVDSVAFLAGAGFLGGFTTFSTWMVETIRLGLPSKGALLNLLVSIAGGFLAVAFGYTLMD